MDKEFLNKKDNFEEILNIKVNDVIFVRAVDFRSLGIEPMGDFFGTTPVLETEEEVKKYNDFLFAIKYIGNGMFTEMTTGKELALCDTSDLKIDGKYNESFNHEFAIEFDEYENQDGFLDKDRRKKVYQEEDDDPNYFFNLLTETEKEVFFNKYIADSEKYKNISTSSPLLGLLILDVNMDGYTEAIKINDESKKKYLEHTDEERKALLEVFRKRAEDSYKEACDKIDEKVNELSEILSKRVDTPTSEDLDMAYLENELYDFQKGRSR